MRKTAGEARQGFEEAVVGKDAVDREPDLGSATGGHQAGALLQLMKASQMGFRIC